MPVLLNPNQDAASTRAFCGISPPYTHRARRGQKQLRQLCSLTAPYSVLNRQLKLPFSSCKDDNSTLACRSGEFPLDWKRDSVQDMCMSLLGLQPQRTTECIRTWCHQNSDLIIGVSVVAVAYAMWFR